jgi:ABC-2 type transport system permease protein
MLARIMRHDLRQLAADRTLYLVAALFTVLLAYGLWNGATWARQRSRQIGAAETAAAAANNLQRQQVLDIEGGRKTLADTPAAGRPAGVSALAYLPPTSLSALAVGQSDLLPYAATVGAFTTKDALVNQSETDNPVNLLAGRFDLAFVIIHLYPLLILALSYNLISHEREQGTLQMTLAQPVSLRAFVAGKVLTRAGVVLAVALLVSFVGVGLSGASLTSAGAASRLLWWTTAVVAYTLFWFAAAVLINAYGKSSATNATALTAVWLALVIVLPVLLNAVATSLHLLPSRLNLINTMREAELETIREARNLLARYMTDHPELAGGDLQRNLDDFPIRFYVQQQERERRALAAANEHDRQLAAQQRIINRYRFLSPAIVMQEALSEVAGTSRARHELFARQIGDFIDVWRARFGPLIFRRATLRPDDYDRLPRFAFQEEPPGEVARRAAAGIAGLALPAMLLAALAFARLRHYRVAG